MRAEKCLICGGRGKVYDGEDYGTTRYGPGFGICYSCNGKGWVEVSDNPVPLNYRGMSVGVKIGK